MIKRETITNGLSKIYKVEFSSIADLVKYNNEGSLNEKAFFRQSSSNRDYYFTKTYTFEESQKLLLEGWSQGAKVLTDKLRVANVNVNQVREIKKTVYDIVGFQASVPRYLQGLPTSMVNKRNVKVKQKSVSLYKSISYSVKIKAEEILEDSVKFLQIVQEIEKQGIRVNVYTVFHSKITKEEIFITTKIKSANERLNLSKLAYPLMHPSFLRRTTFRTMEVDERLQGSWGKKGYGKVVKDEETKSLLNLDKGEYFIPANISKEKALEIVNEIK